MRFPIQGKSREQIEAIQFRRMKKLLEHAYANSTFYASHYRLSGFHPDDFKSMADVAKIPIVSREQLKLVPVEDLITRSGHAAEKLHSHTTSGSSGIPVKISSTAHEFRLTLYTVLRAYLMAGMRLRDRTVALRDPVDIKSPTFYQKLGYLRHDYFDIYEPIDAIYDQICTQNRDIDILKAYPTDLASLGLQARTRGGFPKVKFIYSDSEVLDRSTREFVESTFEAPVIDFYASVECGMIAFQIPGHDKYHVNEDFILLEKQEASGLGENEGEVVISNLYNLTTPIIRYEIGDVIDFGDGNATENSGIPFRTISQIHGKYLDFIVLPDKTVVSPHVPKQDLTHLEGISAFQLVQDDIDHINVKIQKSESFTPATEQEILSRLDKGFRGLVKVEIEYLEQLSRGDRRKFKVIESKVAQDFLTSY